jgi:hypothetical protein
MSSLAAWQLQTISRSSARVTAPVLTILAGPEEQSQEDGDATRTMQLVGVEHTMHLCEEQF